MFETRAGSIVNFSPDEGRQREDMNIVEVCERRTSPAVHIAREGQRRGLESRVMRCLHVVA